MVSSTKFRTHDSNIAHFVFTTCLLLCLYMSHFFSLCGIEGEPYKGHWANPNHPSFSWSTGWNHVILSLLMANSPKKKGVFSRSVSPPQEISQKSTHMRSDKKWETRFLARFYFGYFSTEMTADRSTWETSCICLPFIETRVTRAERVPISDTPHLQFRVKTKRHLEDHLSSEYLLTRSD